MKYNILRYVIIFWLQVRVFVVGGKGGVLLLYRPLDVTHDCAQSNYLHYELSFGMGMSDTITLVFRTHHEVDYECVVTIAAESTNVLILVIRYPNSLLVNCAMNKGAFTFVKNNFNECMEICTLVNRKSLTGNYFEDVTRHFISLRFANNSTINNHLKANFYQVTVTTARLISSDSKCFKKNETTCYINNSKFCFTSGAFCDGIKNCGVSNWYDERSSLCELPEKRLSLTAVLAVVSAICVIVLAMARLIKYCLPSFAKSFFIFSSNDDNRLRIDPHFKSTMDPEYYNMNRKARQSIIPVEMSSSDDESDRMKTESVEKMLKGKMKRGSMAAGALIEIPESSREGGRDSTLPSRSTWATNILRELKDRFISASQRSLRRVTSVAPNSLFNRFRVDQDDEEEK